MRDYFNLSYHKTTYRNEIMAGLSMFISVSYILVVNPTVLSSCGMDYYGVFMATVITSALATLAMALYAKMPFVLAPGLSINAMFVWLTVHAFAGNYRVTLLATYLSGVLFILLMMTGLFSRIDRLIPQCVRYGILMGIGLSLIRTGIGNMHWPQQFLRRETGIVLGGIILILWLEHRKVRGAMFYGMIATALVGYPLVALRGDGSFCENLRQLLITHNIFDSFAWNGEVFFAECFHLPSAQLFVDNPNLLWRLALGVLTLTIFHFTDAVGTTSSLFVMMSDRGAMLPAEYKRKAMYVNGMAEIASGLFGTSSVTSYAESMVGIAEGARTGIAGVTVSVMFIVAGIIVPRTSTIADFVTVPVIIAAGVLSCRILWQLKGHGKREWIVTLGSGLYIGMTFQIAIGFAGGMLFYYALRKQHEITDDNASVHTGSGGTGTGRSCVQKGEQQ